jgi:tRNA A37 threonylcarbamoyltransferase TsaD
MQRQTDTAIRRRGRQPSPQGTASGESPLPVIIPPPVLCTDNAAMVAACGYFRLQQGCHDSLDMDVLPDLKLPTSENQR